MTAPPGFAGRSRLTAAGLMLRRLRNAGVAAVLVVVLTAGVAALVAGIPAGFAAMSADELRGALAEAGPTARNLISVSSAQPVTGPAVDPSSTGLPPELDQRYGLFTEQLAQLRDTFPEPLRGQVGPADWSISTSPVIFNDEDPGTDPAGATQILLTRAVPDPDAHADLIEGTWPTDNGGGDAPVAIALSEDSAAHLGWAVGERHGPFTVNGIFAVPDPDDDYWALNPGMVLANVFDDGDRRPSITVTAFANPLDFTRPGPGARPGTLKIWYPLDLTGLTGGEAEEILGQLRGVTARTNTLTPPVIPEPGALSTLTLTATAIDVLEGVEARLDSARSVLTVAVIGPLGAAFAVLLLGIRALAARRRDTDSLLAVRGASDARLRSDRGIDGLLVGIVPAGVGVAVIGAVFRQDAPVSGLLLGFAVGLVPAAALMAAPVRRHMQRTRPDVAPPRTARLRWLGDVAVCGLAAVSTYLLFAVGVSAPVTEGPTGWGTGDVGADILVAATPLLLAAAACVLVLRLYPAPLGLLVRRLRRGPSAVSYLGAVRGLRDPAVGVAPVLAVVTGMALAMFSALTLSTVDTGITTAAAERLGGPLRLDGPLITDERLAQIQALPGVQAAARVELGGIADLRVDGEPAGTRTDLLMGDTAELAEVQAALGDALPNGPVVPPGGLDPGAGGQGPAGVLVSPGLIPQGYAAAIGTQDVSVVGTADKVPGFESAGAWVLVDRAAGLQGNGPRSVVIAPVGGVTTDPAALVELERQLTAITGEATFRTTQDLVDDVLGNPVNGGLRTALLVATVVAALAAGAAVVLTLVLNTAARARMLAILQVLGLPAKGRRRLVVWEQAPSAMVSLVVGAALGLGITAMMRSVIDLRPFTGGRQAPALVVDPVLLAALVGGFVVVVIAAIAVGVLLSRRRSAAGVVKLDTE